MIGKKIIDKKNQFLKFYKDCIHLNIVIIKYKIKFYNLL